MDLTALLAEMSPVAVDTVVHFGVPMGGMMSIRPSAFDPGSCEYDYPTGFFICPQFVENGMTYTRSFRLINFVGSSQSALDAKTFAIDVKTSMTGSPTTPDGTPLARTFTLVGSSDMRLSGIGTDRHNLNGIATATMYDTTELNHKDWSLNASVETTNDLALPNLRAGERWPRSGTITFQDNMNIPGVENSWPPNSEHVRMAFDGTSIVTVTVIDDVFADTVTSRCDMAHPGSMCTY